MAKPLTERGRLTAKEEAFAAARAAGASQTDAYRASHPKSRASDATARREGFKFDRRPHVRLRIVQLREETKRRVDAAIVEQVTAPAVRVATEIALTRDWVRLELIDNVRRAKQAVPVLTSKGEPTGEYRVDLPAANKALELLGKEIGMFRSTGDDKPNPLDTLNDDQVRELAAAVDEEIARRAAETEDGGGKPH